MLKEESMVYMAMNLHKHQLFLYNHNSIRINT